jgi:Do/DeqQ family serine protease
MKGKIHTKIFLVISLIILTGAVFYGGLMYGHVTAKENRPLEPPASLLSLEQSFKSVVKQVSPAVVNINTEKVIKRGNNHAPMGDEDFFRGTPFENFFKFSQPFDRDQKMTSLGSGVIISPEGYVLTNAHVIMDADKVNITMNDGTQYNNVKLIGYDKASDIGVLKMEAKKPLPYAVTGNSDELEVGSWVLAIGNPYGFNSSVTAGIVSAKGRDLPVEHGNNYGDFSNLIQTDTAINPGSSGGALVNLYGEVVGINTAIISPNGGGSIGMGFSIPINNATSIMGQIIKHGKVIHGWLGIGMQKLTPELAGKFGVDKGVIISEIYRDSPAFKTGIKPGDIIVSIDKKEITGPSDIQKIVSYKKPGDKIEVNIIRDKKPLDINVTIEARPGDNTVSSNSKKQQRDKDKTDAKRWKGLAVTEITGEISDRYGISEEYGVIVEHVEQGSKASIAGFRGGEIIKKINDHVIKNYDDYNQAIKESGEENQSVLLVKSGQYSMFVVI